jgi:hypothetical protein
MIKLVLMKLFLIVIMLVSMAVGYSCSSAEAGKVSAKSDAIQQADRLGEDFQQQGPWSRREPLGDGFYGVPQPKEYQTDFGGHLPQDESGFDTSQYPLCYNPYTSVYEYCYPRESPYFLSRFRSPAFRLWWRKGRICPPGYYFVPDKGCYNH